MLFWRDTRLWLPSTQIMGRLKRGLWGPMRIRYGVRSSSKKRVDRNYRPIARLASGEDSGARIGTGLPGECSPSLSGAGVGVFKANAERHHHVPKQRDRVQNSAEYDAGLRQRGSLTVWLRGERCPETVFLLTTQQCP
jgi:hypothetical protein